MLELAQADAPLTTSSGLLLLLLSGGVITSVVSAYRFWVNVRVSERGLSRQRVQQATNNARSAQHEAYLWQSRCADLTFLLRERGVPVPPLDPELQALVAPNDPDGGAIDWNIDDRSQG